MTTKEEGCRLCGKKTKYMYSFNEGLACEKCKWTAYQQQDFNLQMEAAKERWKNWGNNQVMLREALKDLDSNIYLMP